MSTTPLHPETLAIRAGKETSDYQEHSQAMFLTSSFKSASAAEAAKLFSGEIPGYTYSRFTNPTVSAFQARLAALEGGERAVATASGMAAIHGLVQAFLSAGDHIVASQSLFGATVQLLGNILPSFGIEVTFVAATDLDACLNAERRPDLLILDHAMPTRAGLALLARQHRSRALLFVGKAPPKHQNLAQEARNQGLWVLAELPWPLSMPGLQHALQTLQARPRQRIQTVISAPHAH